MSVAAAIVGAGLSAAGGIGSQMLQNYYNEQAYEQQRDDNIAMWHMQNMYNSPQAQVERLKAAGLNPLYATGNPGNNSQAPSIPMLQKQSPNWGAVGDAVINALSQIMEMKQAAKNMELVQQQISESKSRESLNRQKETNLLTTDLYNAMRNDAFKNADYFTHLAWRTIYDNALTGVKINRAQRDLEFFNRTFEDRVKSYALANQATEAKRDLFKSSTSLNNARKDYVGEQTTYLKNKTALEKAVENYVKEYYRLRNKKVQSDINNSIWSTNLKRRTYHWYPIVVGSGALSKFIPLF